MKLTPEIKLFSPPPPIKPKKKHRDRKVKTCRLSLGSIIQNGHDFRRNTYGQGINERTRAAQSGGTLDYYHHQGGLKGGMQVTGC